MTGILQFMPAEVLPSRDAVLENQGIAPGTVVTKEIDALCRTAIDVLEATAVPVGVMEEISEDDFRGIYDGEGRNEPRTPVADVYMQADHLALFAVTLGKQPEAEIAKRFQSNDFALASMLDAAASAAADRLAGLAEHRYERNLRERGCVTETTGVLRYSPGYCGWDISGQKRLFAFLHPDRIGLILRDSFLMEPLKSVSGLIIAGPRNIHDRPDTYPFCDRCETHGCRKRFRALTK